MITCDGNQPYAPCVEKVCFVAVVGCVKHSHVNTHFRCSNHISPIWDAWEQYYLKCQQCLDQYLQTSQGSFEELLADDMIVSGYP